MNPRVRLALLAAAIAAAAIGVSGLVSAQQGGDAGPPAIPSAPKTAPTIVNDEPPPVVSATQGAPVSASPEPDAASAQPDDEDASSQASAPAPPKPVEPLRRPRYAIAVIQAMDKVTAETMRFEAPINQPIRYKSLIFIVRACETTAPDEAISDAAAHVEIDSEPTAQQGADAPARRVFRGWMFANAPGLNLFENPAYDAWLIACKTASPAA